MNKNFIEKYKEFVQMIAKNDVELTDESIMKYGSKFHQEINSSSKLQKYLKDRNLKFFNTNKKKNTKISIHPDINLKKMIHSVDMNKAVEIWNNLKILYVILEVENPDATETTKGFVNSLLQDLEQNTSTDVNNMIFDIADTFKTLSTTGVEANSNIDSNGSMEDLFCGDTLNNIMKTSQIIAEKYQTKIENGDLTIDDMMGSLVNMISQPEGNDDFMDKIFDKKDFNDEKVRQMKEFYKNQKMEVSSNDIKQMSEKLSEQIENIGDNMGDLMDKNGDIKQLLSGLTQLSKTSPL